jgi:hypothetical protein
MKIGKFHIYTTVARSGQISAVITEGGQLVDAVSGFDFGKVTAAAVRAANFYGVEK